MPANADQALGATVAIDVIEVIMEQRLLVLLVESVSRIGIELFRILKVEFLPPPI